MTTLREWAERWVEIPDDWRVGDDELSVAFGETGPTLTFRATAIAAWRGGALPTHRDLKFVPHCGVELPGYAEYLVDLDHLGQWPQDSPLSFRVGNTLIRLGPVSNALALVLEPYYRFKDAYQYEFSESLSSIQLTGATSARDDALSALFYLNADYLRSAKASARIQHLLDPNSPEAEYDFRPRFATRSRVRRRAAIAANEALRLFVAAANQSDEARFLGFYRVLEYFFARARAAELAAARRDLAIPDAAFIKRVKDENGELPQLRAVVRSALRAAEASAVVRYAAHHRLAKCNTLDELSNALYAHRNALVHAKEPEMPKTVVPDPFVESTGFEKWNWVVEHIAEKCIRRLAPAAAP